MNSLVEKGIYSPKLFSRHRKTGESIQNSIDKNTHKKQCKFSKKNDQPDIPIPQKRIKSLETFKSQQCQNLLKGEVHLSELVY